MNIFSTGTFSKPHVYYSVVSVSILVLFLQPVTVFSQLFTRAGNIPVIISAKTLANPWAGGFNNPQFSTVDMDGDGKKDLFVYDRSPDRIFTFVNQGVAGFSNFIHKPEYQSKFPPLHYFALLVDYDLDGKEDIFVSSAVGSIKGVSVFRNEFSIQSGLSFKMIRELIHADGNPIYISPGDIPAFADVDNDSDIDILTFEFGGALVYFYKNLSQEIYGTNDSLIFTLQDECWGKFMENSADCDVITGIACKKSLQESLHAGSTILAFDAEGDKDVELLVGDITCTSMYFAHNNGNISLADVDTVIKQYPTSHPIDVYRFPAAFLIDADNDNLKDLIVAPNAIQVSENFEGTWFYKNVGSPAAYLFSFQKIDFLQDEMIEVGEGAYPVFFDYNNDSLPDLVIGNYGYYTSNGFRSSLALFKNRGTKTAPAFELVTRDYAGIQSLNRTGIYPSFGDLDGDGDKDLLIGEFNGVLHYYENEAQPGTDADFHLKQFDYDSIDVGLFSTPQIADVNRDGLYDLLVGERNGNINYYQNKGTSSVPQFYLITDSFGKVNVTEPGLISGYSVPFLTSLSSECKYDLLVGSGGGKIYHFTGIDSNLNGTFSVTDTFLNGIYEGQRISISGADVNGDRTLDLVTGNYGGGAAIYYNSVPPSPCSAPLLPWSVNLFTNPAGEMIKINFTGVKSNYSSLITLYNLLGKLIFYREINSSEMSQVQIPAGCFSNGIYILRVKAYRGDVSEEIIKKIVLIKME